MGFCCFDFHAVRRKDHSVKAFQDGVRIAAEHQHIGSFAIKAHFQECAHAACGCEPAGVNQVLFGGLFDRCTGLTMQKLARSSTRQPQERKPGIPEQLINRCAHAESSLARAATSLSLNKLTNSRPAASMASWPPSSRSTIVTTRSTR